MSGPYEVRLAPTAARDFKKLPAPLRERIRTSLEQLAQAAAETGRIRGKKVKTIRGHADTFHRLRVGDYRVMYDLIPDDRVLLVLGIVHRSDLERWLRAR
ncbi:MAG: type II toxin-antitoxin system RelE/ParE family toxin [Actinobacteria bacterium]|nr:type II toxin-antitoxin system RelE/ParE family toxin [Actinomycetota bacterium]